MPQKRKPRGGRRNLQITIYPKTGRSIGKITFRKKSLVVKQEVSSIDTTLPTQAEVLLIKLAK